MGRELEYYHCHSYLSNIFTANDSPASVEDYAKAYSERGSRTFCLTEHGNRSDVFQQYDLLEKYNLGKVIAGAEVYFVPDRNPELKDRRNFHLVVLAKNMNGFHQLNKLCTLANTTGYYGKARVDFELLSQLNPKDFLITTACVGGIILNEDGEKYAKQLYDMFGKNFYLEVQGHRQQIQLQQNYKILQLYKKYGWPLIYATDSHYINKEDKILRTELQLSGGVKYTQQDEDSFDLYLPTADEAYQMMIDQNLLSKAQINEAFDNTLQLRDWDGLTFDKSRKMPVSNLRRNDPPQKRKHDYQKLVCDGYIKKFGMPSDAEKKELRDEMNTIIETDSYDYFLSEYDLLNLGVQKGGILTTTARGSAGSFATNAGLGFTTINRLRFPVTFYPERFISKDKLKTSMPDVDMNISNVEAFEEAGKELFGEYGCMPMIAYGKTKTSSAFKLLARSRNLDFETSNEISKQLQIYEKACKFAIEENSDDPDYDVNDDIRIEDYVSSSYLQIVNDSKQYKNIIVSVAPHPCAHLTYHEPVDEAFGVIKVKDKFCVYVDGTTADGFGYTKTDLLRVDVVKIINDSFRECGLDVMSVDQLLEAVKGDENIWNLYARGFTQGLNQCEKPASTQKIMRFKPQNIVELSSFVAAIRPGFKDNVAAFCARQPFKYGVKALDDLLKIDGMTGQNADSAWLMYDQQILKLLKASGIPGPKAYAITKYIKKKKRDKVLAAKDEFKAGFTKYLIEKENTSEEHAHEVVELVWSTIENASSYAFCAAHAAAMACDSLYGAWLKAYHPFEFYKTMLKLYTEKGNREKVSLIISEMKKYKNISLIVGKFGQDNRDWYVDKEKNTISQSLSSIKFVSSQAAEDLYSIRDKHFDTFTDLLRELQMNTSLNTRQIQILIMLGYFDQFGSGGKLMTVFREFFEGKNKITNKTTKSLPVRMEAIKALELSGKDEPLPISTVLSTENEMIQLCVSKDESASRSEYFVQAVDDKYGIKVHLYQVCSGKTGQVKITKKNYEAMNIVENQLIIVESFDKKQRFLYKDGTRIPVKDEYDLWLNKWRVTQ